jgi:hypothetical protein
MTAYVTTTATAAAATKLSICFMAAYLRPLVRYMLVTG